MLPVRRLTRIPLSSTLVRSLTAAPRAAPFLSHSIRSVSTTMDIVFTKDAAPPAGPYVRWLPRGRDEGCLTNTACLF
ncbi:hypothetical protein FJTKL_14840 [Diaporthe vaccinii]|uniref:Uncharacterized protein n=1 Tax=Diaporthe vaccinii TaxID=105482 RepID=A0ABR4F867_9PEZI